jgi:transcriptional regulator with PAS, ATPase and Fis domain
VIGSGMQHPISNSQREESMIKVTSLGFDKTELEKCYNRMKKVNRDMGPYAINSLKLVAKDVETFYKMLYKNEEIKKEHEIHRDGIYKEKYSNIIGKSSAIKGIFDTLELIENTKSPVLIEGESGTGKELIASAIHYNSFCKNEVIIIQNCSAFSDALLSSELFGHEKGSFTGATLEKKGLFEIADGGTLFLDEIGDMSKEVQGRLLRVLENGTFYRVGGTKQKEVDVRIIVASNKNLKKQVKEGLFRKDLFYRINTFHINISPLRDRKEDILPLLHYFLEASSKIRKEEEKEVSPEVFKVLANHDWPGNVRELKNVVECLITLSGNSKTIELEHVPMEIMQSAYHCTIDHGGNRKLRDILESTEEEIIRKKLKMMKWNKTVTSRELGISRASLNRRIARFNIRQKTS